MISEFRMTSSETNPNSEFQRLRNTGGAFGLPCSALFRISPPTAFTVIELLVVVTVLGLLAAMLFPALAKSRPNSLVSQCLNNNRQLCAAWRMYADDNGGRLVSSEWDTGTSKNSSWVTSTIDFDSSNTANWNVEADITRRPFWPYTGRN